MHPWFSHINSHYNLLQEALQGSEALAGTRDPCPPGSACQPQCCLWNPDSTTCGGTKPIKIWLNWQGPWWGLPTKPPLFPLFSAEETKTHDLWEILIWESVSLLTRKMFYFPPKKHSSLWESCALGQPTSFQPLVLSSPTVTVVPNGKIAASWGWSLVLVWKTVILCSSKPSPPQNLMSWMIPRDCLFHKTLFHLFALPFTEGNLQAGESAVCPGAELLQTRRPGAAGKSRRLGTSHKSSGCKIPP